MTMAAMVTPGPKIALTPWARSRRPEALVFAGGVIPASHARRLRAQGVSAIFGPGATMAAIVMEIAGALLGDAGTASWPDAMLESAD